MSGSECLRIWRLSTRSARGEPGEIFGVAVGVQVVLLVEQVLQIRLQAPPFRQRIDTATSARRVAGSVTVLSTAANISDRMQNA